MQLRSLPTAAQWYVRAVIGLGTVALLVAALTVPMPWTPALAAAMLAAAALGSQKLVLVGLPGDPGSRTHVMSTLSLGFPMVLGSMLWFGPGGGMAVGVASAVGASLYPRRHPVYRLWFTSVTLGLTALASGVLMQRLGASPERSLLLSPLPLLAGTLTYYLLNSGTVSMAVALSQRTNPWITWRSSYLWSAPSYLAGAAIVAGTQSLFLGCSSAVALLSLLCVFLVHHSYRSYLEKLHQLQVSENRLQEVCMAAVESLALAIDAKDCATHSHIRRVQQIALALAEQVRVTPAELQAIRVGSLTHDVGKLAVPDTILAKAGRLSQEEFERVKIHVPAGVRILEPVQFPWPVVEVVESHHERWDGLGYPNGMKGDEIPLGGRIVAIADVFDALTAPRPYRAALSFEEAHAVICAGSGSQFDPQLVEAFTTIFPHLVGVLTATDITLTAAGDPGDDAAARTLGDDAPRAAGSVWEEIRGASRESLSVAFTDPLTGLVNGRFLANALPRELENAAREGRSLSLLMMDLDGFKAINDRHGHLVGDAALQQLARLMKDAIREDGTVCRYAGDEFVVLLPGAGREQALRVADRLSARVDECVVTGTTLPLGLSIGVASFPGDGEDAATLLHAADLGMYQQKEKRKAALLCRLS